MVSCLRSFQSFHSIKYRIFLSQLSGGLRADHRGHDHRARVEILEECPGLLCEVYRVCDAARGAFRNHHHDAGKLGREDSSKFIKFSTRCKTRTNCHQRIMRSLTSTPHTPVHFRRLQERNTACGPMMLKNRSNRKIGLVLANLSLAI